MKFTACQNERKLVQQHVSQMDWVVFYLSVHAPSYVYALLQVFQVRESINRQIISHFATIYNVRKSLLHTTNTEVWR